MEELKRQVAKENEQLEKRKKAIDVELSEIEPLVQVKRGVFNITINSSLRLSPFFWRRVAFTLETLESVVFDVTINVDYQCLRQRLKKRA